MASRDSVVKTSEDFFGRFYAGYYSTRWLLERMRDKRFEGFILDRSSK